MAKAKWLGKTKIVIITCPGCNTNHYLNTDPDRYYDVGKTVKMPCWQFNGNMDAPTFSPSLLVKTGKHVNPNFVNDVPESDREWAKSPQANIICHSFIRDGNIQFLGDSTHPLAGKTVGLPPIQPINKSYES